MSRYLNRGWNSVGSTYETWISEGAPSTTPPSGNPVTDVTYTQIEDDLQRPTGSKFPVRVCSTTNLTLSGLQAIDGVSLVAGDRVLAAGQSNAIQNGIYVVAAGVWARAADLVVGLHVANIFVFISEGTVRADQLWVCTTDPPNDIIGTHSLVFARMSADTGIHEVELVDTSINAATVNLDTVLEASSVYTLDIELVGRRSSPSLLGGRATFRIKVETGVGGITSIGIETLLTEEPSGFNGWTMAFSNPAGFTFRTALTSLAGETVVFVERMKQIKNPAFNLPANIIGTYVPTSRQIIAGAGITVNGGASASLAGDVTVAATASQVGARIAPDADDVLYFKFDQANPPFTNTGSLGSAQNFVLQAGSAFKGGLNGPVFRDGGGLNFSTQTTASLQFTSPHFAWPAGNLITVSLWFTPTRFTGTNNIGRVFYKAYYPSSWSAPYWGTSMEWNNSGNNFTIGQQNASATLDTNQNYITPWTPHHLGYTFGDGFLKVYLDGSLISSTVNTNSLDLGTGPWLLGYTVGSPNQEHSGCIFEEIRVSKVVRNAAWFLNVWNNGNV